MKIRKELEILTHLSKFYVRNRQRIYTKRQSLESLPDVWQSSKDRLYVVFTKNI